MAAVANGTSGRPATQLHISSNNLAGKVALVTGASSGIGKAVAFAFARAGAKLVLHGRDEARLKAVADAIIAEGGQAVTLTGEAGVEATQKALVELAITTYGALHIAFNNAGTFAMGKLADIKSETVDHLLNTNVKSIIYGMKYQLPAMSKSSSVQDWGVIINNSSTLSSRVRSGGAETIALYAASKSAVDTLTQYAALEGAPLFVRVNAVNPGMTRTSPMPAPGAVDNFANMCAQASLVPTPNTTDELAAFVTFVADNKTGRFFNGSLLRMDGGLSCK